MASFPEATKAWAQQMKERVGLAIHVHKNQGKIPKALEELLETKDKAKVIPSLPRELQEIVRNPELFTDKKLVAEVIYTELTHRYSFIEALERGIYAPWPHELSEVTCASQALVNFVVEQVCGLDPELWEFGGFQPKGRTHFGGHSLTLVDVGEKHPWVIDQSMELLGPVTWKGNTLTIVNKSKGDKAEEYTFVCADQYDEASYAERMAYQRSPEGSASMLLNGQRLGLPEIDAWKTKEPLRVPWFLRYDHDARSIITLMGFERPLMQKRGLDLCMRLNQDGRIEEETVRGYFYRELGWVEFLGKYPVVEIPAAEIPSLIPGIEEFSIEEQIAFEEKAMALATAEPLDRASQHLRDAIYASYERLQATRFGDAVKKFALVEALYQEKRNGQEYVYSPVVRKRGLEQMQHQDAYVKDLLRAMKDLQRGRKFKERVQKLQRAKGRQIMYRGRRVYILDPQRLEDPAVQEYLSIDGPLAKLEYMLAHKPRFIDDAIDRILFVQWELAQHAGTLESLEAYARNVFGNRLEQELMRGYARIFAEFLGHIAHAWELLSSLGDYKKDIVKKVQAYQGTHPQQKA
ncbi:hypothetical protein HYS48_01630 [Candidatus Woesearchaeota archaeon]|nr:hypothetical protein [Candidatus Woesearchaeota archaeon]